MHGQKTSKHTHTHTYIHKNHMHQILGPWCTAISEDLDKRGSGIKETSFFCERPGSKREFCAFFFRN